MLSRSVSCAYSRCKFWDIVAMPIVLVFRIAITQYYKLSCPSNRNFLVSQFWKLDIRDQVVDRVSSESVKETVSCLSPASGDLLAIFAFPWPVGKATLISAFIFIYVLPVINFYVFKFLLLIKNQSKWSRSLFRHDLVLTNISMTTLFPNKVTFWHTVS